MSWCKQTNHLARQLGEFYFNKIFILLIQLAGARSTEGPSEQLKFGGLTSRIADVSRSANLAMRNSECRRPEISDMPDHSTMAGQELPRNNQKTTCEVPWGAKEAYCKYYESVTEASKSLDPLQLSPSYWHCKQSITLC